MSMCVFVCMCAYVIAYTHRNKLKYVCMYILNKAIAVLFLKAAHDPRGWPILFYSFVLRSHQIPYI